MKKSIVILLCIITAIALIACDQTPPMGDPDDTKSFEEAQSNFEAINDSNDKSDIEKNIKDVFGVSLSLPNGSEYIAETIELDAVSSYVVMIKGAAVSKEDYFNSIKSKFSGWTEIEGGLGFSYETENVLYGAVVEEGDGYLGIVFSITDKEVANQFVSQDQEFVNEIKKYSGVTVTLPECVESIGLPDLRNDGAKVSYGGMLLGANGCINKAEFDEFVASLDSQLSGYTKTVEGEDDDMTVVWKNNADPSKYFEAEYYEFDGTPMTSFSYNYTDMSLLTPWPTDEINELFGVDAGVAEYNGLYDDLIFEGIGEYEEDNSVTIYLKGVTEEEFNAYFTLLESNGFAKIGGESEYSDEYWSKQISETLYVEMDGYYSGSYYDNSNGTGTIHIYKTVLENVTWPASEIEAQLGSKAAALIPTMPSAQRRTFEVYDDDYRYIYVKDIVDHELFTSYCEDLEAAGFTVIDEWGENYKQYEYQWDDYDRLEISVEYTGADDAGNKYIYVRINYQPYESFITLPTNVRLSYSTLYSYSTEPTVTTVTKIGEDWFFEGQYSKSYYKYDAATKTWSVYSGYSFGSEGGITWIKDDKTYDRYSIDKELENALSGIYVEKIKEEPEEFTKGSTTTILGQSCVKYVMESGISTYTSVTEYEYNEATGLVFKMTATQAYGDDVNTSTVEITEYDTSISSFASVGITSDMLPNE